MVDKMVEIQCLACDKTLKLPQFVNTDNYDGQVKCPECKSLLHIKLVKSKVLKYKIVENKSKQTKQYNIIVQDDETKAQFNKLLEGKKPQDVVVKEDEQ